MIKNLIFIIVFIASFSSIYTQTIHFEGREFEISKVKAEVVRLNGEEALKIERDLEALPFDLENLTTTVDEPTFVKLKDFKLKNGAFEVKVLSRIQTPSPFPRAQGFIGLAFRVTEDNTAYESIYIRPNVGRSGQQSARNHTVQYYAYPDFKFNKLRNPEYKGQYETYADVGLDEWITLRIEVEGKKAMLYINDQKYPSFIVNEMLGKSETGSIGLWVDIGTKGYFKDFKIFNQN